jgi:YVTN family beta-propeller protein
MTNSSRAIMLATLALLCSCRKDKPERPDEPPITIGNSGGVYITNEGNFQWGNAKVSYYDIATQTSTEDLFQPANGFALGDVCQSMRLFNSKAYVVVNNSGKVVVADPNTFVQSAVITGFNSPRCFLPVSNNKAYVTDLYANSIAVVDLGANAITGSISCPGWTEELVLACGKAFVTNQSRNFVYVIDTATDQLLDSIAVSRGGNSIVEDAQGQLWVACSGGSGTDPALYRIDPQTMQVLQVLSSPSSSERPWRLTTNGGNDTLYYLNNGVCRIAISATELPSTTFIAANGRNFYGLGIEPNSGVVYISDAIDFVQRGKVYRYRTDGTVINEFLAGTTPGSFVFR